MGESSTITTTITTGGVSLAYLLEACLFACILPHIVFSLFGRHDGLLEFCLTDVDCQTKAYKTGWRWKSASLNGCSRDGRKAALHSLATPLSGAGRATPSPLPGAKTFSLCRKRQQS